MTYAAHQDAGLAYVRQLEVTNLVLALLAVPIVHLAAGPGSVLWGVVAGAAVNVVNLRAIAWLSLRLMRAERRSKGFYVGLFGAKLCALAGACAAALALLPIAPLGFVLGFSTLMPASLLVALRRSLAPADPRTNRARPDADASRRALAGAEPRLEPAAQWERKL